MWVYARAALVGRMSIGAVAGRGFEIGVVVVISGLKVEGRCVMLRYGNGERTRGARWDNRVGFGQRFEQTFCGTFKGSLARSSMLLRSRTQVVCDQINARDTEARVIHPAASCGFRSGSWSLLSRH
jgi:hypothetical protein